MDEQDDGGSISADSEIEVGKTGREMRLCRAREAVRQGETRLAGQASSRSVLESRATALTGWSSAGLLAVSAAFFSATQWQVKTGAGFAALGLFFSAAICIYVCRAGDDQEWATAGYDPVLILDDVLNTELELVESIAEGLAPGIQENFIRLKKMANAVRRASYLLISAPLLGLVIYAGLLTTIRPEEGVLLCPQESASRVDAAVRGVLP